VEETLKGLGKASGVLEQEEPADQCISISLIVKG
jgi:hypothetical protein